MFDIPSFCFENCLASSSESVYGIADMGLGEASTCCSQLGLQVVDGCKGVALLKNGLQLIPDGIIHRIKIWRIGRPLVGLDVLEIDWMLVQVLQG